MRDLYRYRDLIWELVRCDLKVRYRRSILGFFWTMGRYEQAMRVAPIAESTGQPTIDALP